MAKIKGIIEERYKPPVMDEFPAGGPGGPPPMSGPTEYIAAVYIEDGKYISAKSKSETVDGKVGDDSADKIKITSDAENFNGVYVKGSKSDYTLTDSTIVLSNNGKNDFSGIGAGAMADEGATLTLENVTITTNGVLRNATVANKKSTLKVYNSTLIANGGTLPPDYVPVIGPGMAEPPAPLGISGNCRAHLTMDNSKSYFYDCTIVADGWGALSTDASMGYVYLEANNCLIKTTRNGYGAYSDGGCKDVFNNCDFNSSVMAGILAGQCNMTFNNCSAVCGKYFAMIHCVMGMPTERAAIFINGGDIETDDAAFLVKSHNADIIIDSADIFSNSGTLIQTVVNDDPDATKVKGLKVYGVTAVLKHVDLEGNIFHDDNERNMSVKLETSTLTGVIKNARVSLDQGSKWNATGDSNVIFIADLDTDQIDAPEGVTITAEAAESGVFKLAGGGTLKVTAR